MIRLQRQPRNGCLACGRGGRQILPGSNDIMPRGPVADRMPFQWINCHLLTFWLLHGAALSEDQVKEGLWHWAITEACWFVVASLMYLSRLPGWPCNQEWPWKSSRGHMSTFSLSPGETVQHVARRTLEPTQCSPPVLASAFPTPVVEALLCNRQTLAHRLVLAERKSCSSP